MLILASHGVPEKGRPVIPVTGKWASELVEARGTDGYGSSFELPDLVVIYKLDQRIQG